MNVRSILSVSCAFLCVLSAAFVCAWGREPLRAGPLKSTAGASVSKSAPAHEAEKIRNDFRANINGAKTFYAELLRKTRARGADKVVSGKGFIFYRRNPMSFMLETPGEKLLVEKKKIKRYLKKYGEIYVKKRPEGSSNPVLDYLDIPFGNAVLAQDSECGLVISFRKDDETVEICYNKKERMIEKIVVKNPLSETETEIVKYVKNGDLKKGVFKLPSKARVIDVDK